MAKVAFFDLDKTLYDGFLFADWVKFLLQFGITSIKELTEEGEAFIKYKLGQITYLQGSEIITNEMGKMLKDKNTKEIREHSKEFLKQLDMLKFYDYMPNIFEILQKANYKIVLVTNEPDFIADELKNIFVIDDALGIVFEEKEGKFTGRQLNDLHSKYGKKNELEKYIVKNNVDKGKSFAVGDSEGDIEMIKLFGRGVMLNTDNEMQKEFEGMNVKVIEREVPIVIDAIKTLLI